MNGSARNISLTSLDDLFSTQEGRENATLERIVEIPLEQLYTFKNHPFRVVDDEEMQKTADSIREYGVLMPGIVRPRAEGGYEIISGHRRKRGCEIAGRTTMPVIVRELDDDEATIIMVDSNLQRENILPSERAAAYQMKMEAIRRSAGRPSKENCDQLGHNFSGQRSIDIIAENAPDSRNQIQRFIRLNNLEKPLLQMVDDGKIAFTPAVELSYLKPKEQRLLLETMAAQQSTPSLSQAQRMKKLSQDGILTHGSMVEILSEVKKPPRQALTPVSTMEKSVSNEQAFSAEQAQDKGWIRLTKTDRKTGNPISGVQFNIYYNDQFGEGLAATMTTGVDGVAMSEPIRKGRYIVKEHGATAGYLFEEVTLECTVKSDEITDLTATNRPVGVKLKLFKRDKDEYQLFNWPYTWH